MVAITVIIGNADIGAPNRDIINISAIVPPPIGNAVISSVDRSARSKTFVDVMSKLNKYTRNSILNAFPTIDPSLWKFVPSGITDDAISFGMPIFCVAVMLLGIDAADEQVDRAVMVGVIIYLKYLLMPSLPPAIYAYSP